jgi:hypothetical protein
LIGRLREIAVPSGSWSLTIDAPRHLVVRRELDARAAIALSAIELKPLPAVRGKVVRVDDEKITPVGGAQLIREDGKVQIQTLDNGTFSAELQEPIPEELMVIHPGSATAVVPLKNLEAENNLGDIRLVAGATLALRIDRPGDDSVGAVKVTLFRLTRDKYEPVRIASKDLAASDSNLEFTDLARGDYMILVEGSGANERLTEELEIREAASSRTIAIEPYHLLGTARFGDEPLTNGQLGIVNRLWESVLAIDDRGQFDATLWQHGELSGFIRSKALGSGMFVESPELGTDPSHWDIALRRRVIQGQVVDAETKAPLSEVAMDVKISSENSQSSSLNNLEQDGRFTIPAVANGTYDLRFTHPDRIDIIRSIELKPDSDSQTLTIELGAGVETPIDFVWPDGSHIAQAAAIEGVARDGYNAQGYFRADSTGRLNLRSKPGESRTLYVMPDEGSFAIVHVTAGRSSQAVVKRVIIPRPTASLAVSNVDASGKPVSAIPIIRYNGELLPFSLIPNLSAERIGLGAMRFTRLPAGTYEVWGVVVKGDLLAATATPPATVPERVGLSTGDQSVTVHAVEVP